MNTIHTQPVIKQLQRRFLHEAISRQINLPAEIIDTERFNALVDETFKHVQNHLFGQEQVMNKLATVLKSRNSERFVGWNEAVRTLRPNWDRRPIASVLAVGTTGVGKTETAKEVANLLFNGHLIVLNGTDVGPESPHSISMWTGSSPGYVGSDRGGILTNGLRLHQSGVILIDEIEKADHMAIQNIILPLMGEGVVTDHNNGEQLYATDFVVFCTSNALGHGDSLYSFGFHAEKDNQEAQERALYNALSSHIWPEILGRFNAILPYKELTLETQWQIWSSLRHELSEKIGPGTKIVLTEEARRWVQDQFGQMATGARGINDLFIEKVTPLCVGTKPGVTINITVANGNLRLSDANKVDINDTTNN